MGMKKDYSGNSSKQDFDINKVDPEWIKNQKSKKELKAALSALKEDGNFIELIKICEKRLKQVDPRYGVVPSKGELKIAHDDINDFFNKSNEKERPQNGGL